MYENDEIDYIDDSIKVHYAKLGDSQDEEEYYCGRWRSRRNACGIFCCRSREIRLRFLKKNEKLGKKIYITGKGRCNLTNACDVEELFFLNVKS